jgi:hypothetical protein
MNKYMPRKKAKDVVASEIVERLASIERTISTHLKKPKKTLEEKLSEEPIPFTLPITKKGMNGDDFQEALDKIVEALKRDGRHREIDTEGRLLLSISYNGIEASVNIRAVVFAAATPEAVFTLSLGQAKPLSLAMMKMDDDLENMANSLND